MAITALYWGRISSDCIFAILTDFWNANHVWNFWFCTESQELVILRLTENNFYMYTKLNKTCKYYNINPSRVNDTVSGLEKEYKEKKTAYHLKG